MNLENFEWNAVVTLMCGKCGESEVVPYIMKEDLESLPPRGWVQLTIDGDVSDGSIPNRVHFFCEKCARAILPGYLEKFSE